MKGWEYGRDAALGTAYLALVDYEEHSQEWLCYWPRGGRYGGAAGTVARLLAAVAGSAAGGAQEAVGYAKAKGVLAE